MTNVAITTSLGEKIAIAVKHPKLEAGAEEAHAVTIEVEIAEVAETVVVEDSSNVTTAEEIAEEATVEEAVEVNAETTVVAETVVVEDSSNVTIAEEIAEAATVEEAIEVATIVDRPAENIVAAMIADPRGVIPENQVDGGPKARAAPADAEISRKAFI